MEIENDWPNDASGHTFVLRAVQSLVAAGIEERDAQDKICDWVKQNGGDTVLLANPAGGWVSLPKDVFLVNRRAIFSAGKWRSHKIRERSFSALRDGGAGFVFLSSKYLGDITAPKSKGGPKPTYDSHFLRETAMKWLEANGEPSETTANFGRQAELIVHLQEVYAAKHHGEEPSDSLLKKAKYVPAYIREFRKSKQYQSGS
jgi:hypothetical protein